MAVTANGFTWNVNEDTVGLFCATNSNNDIGLRCCLYDSTFKQYGSAHIFFDLSYVPQNNGKLKIAVNGTTATNDMRTHYGWNISGTIKANGITIFSGSLTSSDGDTRHGSGSVCTLAGGDVKSGVIDYSANSQGSISIAYECSFSIAHKIELVYPAGSVDGWTNSGTMTADAKSATYSHTHNLTTKTVSNPTCTTTGLSLTSCSACDYSYTESIAMLGHTWDSGVITAPSTYETAGTMLYTCVVCSETKTEMLDKLPATIYIDNGSNFDGYGIYIDNGSDWDAYAVYMDDGEKFIAYC